MHAARIIGGFAALVLLTSMAACTGAAPKQSVPPPTTVPTGAARTSSPSPSSSPTPTVDPTQLKPGTNHNYAATEYTYEAKDIQACLPAGPGAVGRGSSASATPHRSATPRATAGPGERGNCPAGKKLVFLTFDDGPNNRMTPKVLDALKDADVPATFYYVTNADGLGGADPQIVKRTIAEGHSINIHSHTHDYKRLYPGGRGNADAILADRKRALEEVRKVLGQEFSVTGYRYPGGHQSWKNLAEADRRLAEEGSYWVEWNAMNGDAEVKGAPTSVEGQLAMVTKTAREAGDPDVIVLLMHDHRYADITAAAVPKIVQHFKERGYEFGVIN